MGGGISKETRIVLDPVGYLIGGHGNKWYDAISDPMGLFAREKEDEDLIPNTSTTTTTDLDEEARKASMAEDERLKKRKGYKSTVLTSMGGDLSTQSTLKQTLGGS